MAEYSEFQLPDGSKIVVEIAEDPRLPGYRPVARDTDQQPEHSFKEALDRIRPVADGVMDALRSLAVRPDDIEVEFGVKLSGKVGAIIASTGTEANFKIKLKWNARSASNAPAVAATAAVESGTTL
jgi:hypothetical protein